MADGQIFYRRRPIGMIVVMVICLIATSRFAQVGRDGNDWGWAATVVAACATGFSFGWLRPKISFIKLQAEGFYIYAPLRRQLIRWREIEAPFLGVVRFSLFGLPYSECLCWNYHSNVKSAHWLRLALNSGAGVDDYVSSALRDLQPAELVKLMAKYWQDAQSRPDDRAA